MTRVSRRVTHVAGSVIALCAGLGPAALVPGCSDPVAPVTTAAVAGIYGLVTVHGQPLPALFGSGPGIASTIVADTIALAANGTWTDRVTWGDSRTASARGGQSFAGTWRYDARAGVVWQIEVVEYVADSVAMRVDARAQSLTFDAGPDKPLDYGTGLWVYRRAP